jgi:hypothetical protein
MNLQDILTKYGVPDPSIVGKLPKGGTTLDFVGHAEITRILLEIDPNWSWEPVAWAVNGRPFITEVNGTAVMWGRLTVLGQSRLGVGSARADKGDLDKELIGDFLRNAAMRFGISLSLWSKSEWEEQPQAPKVPDTKVAIERFRDACRADKLDPEAFAQGAIEGIVLDKATPEQVETLRAAFRKHKAEAPKTEAPKAEAPKAKAPAGEKLTANQVTVMCMKKKIGPKDRLEMATDIAKRPITALDQLSEDELLTLRDIVEMARVQN